MHCPKCQHEIGEDTQFCPECGEKLGLKCFECGKILPLSANFCDKCGHGWSLTGIPARERSKGSEKTKERARDGGARLGRADDVRGSAQGFSASKGERDISTRTKIFLFVAIFYAVLLTYLAVAFLSPSSGLARMASLSENFWVNFVLLGFVLLIITLFLFGLSFVFWRKVCKTRWFQPRLGELLVTDGYITKRQLKEALGEQELRMGEVLIDAGRVTRQQLKEALARQKKTPAQRLGDILKEMGHATEDDVYWALGKTQRKLGEILQEKRLVSEYDLDWVLAKQEYATKR
ncbi:MAG: zinc ribbon domain-containing protein [Pseudomonadota bacterium]